MHHNTSEDLIAKIKQKKELSDLPNFLVKEHLEKYLKNNLISITNLSGRSEKIIVKDIRAQLRKLAGRFQPSSSERTALLKKSDYSSMLLTHSSTKERIQIYPQIKKIISDLDVKSILDLGCGLNPLALAEPAIFYYASDIKMDELKIIENFFKKNDIKGKTFFYDLRKIDGHLPEADLCLILKVFDVLETKGHKLAEKIILSLKCKYLLISFSTKTLSGRPMNHPQRGWIERLLSRLNYKFRIFRFSNEIFYLAQKLS